MSLTTNLTTKPVTTWHTLAFCAEIVCTVALAGALWSKQCRVNPLSGRQGVGGSNPPCSTQKSSSKQHGRSN